MNSATLYTCTGVLTRARTRAAGVRYYQILKTTLTQIRLVAARGWVVVMVVVIRLQHTKLAPVCPLTPWRPFDQVENKLSLLINRQSVSDEVYLCA